MAEKRFVTRFYRTPAGTELVREFLRALPKEARVKCGEYMQRLEWRGFPLATSHLKKLSGDIWELRPEYGGNEYRLYFGVRNGQAIYVHAVVKKQQRADADDIKLAQTRFNEWKVTK